MQQGERERRVSRVGGELGIGRKQEGREKEKACRGWWRDTRSALLHKIVKPRTRRWRRRAEIAANRGKLI